MNDHLSAERPTFVSHLECSMTGERYEADRLHGLSRAAAVFVWARSVSSGQQPLMLRRSPCSANTPESVRSRGATGGKGCGGSTA